MKMKIIEIWKLKIKKKSIYIKENLIIIKVK